MEQLFPAWETRAMGASLTGISLTRQPAVIVNSYSADVLIDRLDLVLTLLEAELSSLSLGKAST